MDKLQWFKFSPSDWTMGRISRTSFAVQGEFLRFCCTYWNKECMVTEETAQHELSDKAYKILLSKGIIKVSTSIVKIDFLDAQLEDIRKLQGIASKAGKASALAREQKRIASISTGVERNSTEKSKSKREDLYRVIDHLSITKLEYSKLQEVYSNEIIEHVLDSIENYKSKDHYTSLYLTAKTWLKDKPKKIDNITENNTIDNFATNVMKQINKQ